MSYDLRNINVSKDKAEVIGLLDQYLNVEGESKDKFEWNYNNNPIKNSTGIVLISKKNNEVVGIINQIYRTFLIKEKKIVIGLFGDLAVDIKHRSLMPALMLLKQAIKSSLADSPLVYSYPNKKAVLVALRAGMARLGVISRYVNVVYYTQYIEKLMPFPLLGRAIGSALSFLKQVFYALKFIRVGKKYTVKYGFPNEQELDKLIKRSVLRQYISAYRTVCYLKWRFTSDSYHKYNVLACYSRQTGDLESYVIFESDDNLLSIRDIYALDFKSFNAALYFSYKYALKNKLSAVSISFLGSNKVKNWIIRSGFRCRESERSVVYKSLLDENETYISNYNNWYLLDGDEDQ